MPVALYSQNYVGVPRSPAVYSIKNTVTGQEYFGSTVNMRNRWARHLSSLYRGDHPNPPLQVAFDEYGLEAFELYILHDTCDLDLEFREIKLAKNCYNLIGQKGKCGCIFTMAQHAEMFRLRNKGWLLREIAEKFGGSVPYISRVLRGERGKPHLMYDDAGKKLPREKIKRVRVFPTQK